MRRLLEVGYVRVDEGERRRSRSCPFSSLRYEKLDWFLELLRRKLVQRCARFENATSYAVQDSPLQSYL